MPRPSPRFPSQPRSWRETSSRIAIRKRCVYSSNGAACSTSGTTSRQRNRRFLEAGRTTPPVPCATPRRQPHQTESYRQPPLPRPRSTRRHAALASPGHQAPRQRGRGPSAHTFPLETSPTPAGHAHVVCLARHTRLARAVRQQPHAHVGRTHRFAHSLRPALLPRNFEARRQLDVRHRLELLSHGITVFFLRDAVVAYHPHRRRQCNAIGQILRLVPKSLGTLDSSLPRQRSRRRGC
jgi:hypothetical protein